MPTPSTSLFLRTSRVLSRSSRAPRTLGRPAVLTLRSELSVPSQ
ncbi:hypothetical protein CRUP_020015 [Coryphaenoides rupestris]|nr:hypothetical protein CRUP_020015 [Coryphaenoides rupestris]